jgi:hypothetical protein
MLREVWVKPGETPRPALEQNLSELLSKIRVEQIQQMIYDRVLDSDEQCQYNKHRRECAAKAVRCHPQDIWLAQARDQPHDQIIVECAWRANLLTASDRDWLFSQLGKTEPISWQIGEAVKAGGLVIVVAECEVYWQQQRLDVEWHRFPRLWTLLIALARKAKLRAGVSERDIFDGEEGCSNSALSESVRRLKRLLPASLAKEIERGVGKRPRRLKLSPHQIHVFDQTGRRG